MERCGTWEEGWGRWRCCLTKLLAYMARTIFVLFLFLSGCLVPEERLDACFFSVPCPFYLLLVASTRTSGVKIMSRGVFFTGNQLKYLILADTDRILPPSKTDIFSSHILVDSCFVWVLPSLPRISTGEQKKLLILFCLSRFKYQARVSDASVILLRLTRLKGFVDVPVEPCYYCALFSQS